ncbi:hypothetical protein KSS87_023137 [Heliosperma pusillum]|nr:hypothetical protein KSS87_023137 [Heliosperma pusillum]
MQFLDSLDDHGFSEEEMRLTIEYGMNCHVRSLLDSLCDGDLSFKSDDEAYDLFDWLNRESRKPNFSLLSSIEENIIVDFDEAFEPLSDDVVDDVVERFGIEPVLFHDNYELGEVSGTLDMDEVEKFGACKVKPLSDTTTFEDVFSREECVDFGETLLNSCDANPFEDEPCWDEHVDDSWEVQVDAIEAALNGSGNSSFLEFFELDLSESELDDIEAAFMDEMAKSENENHGDDTSKIVDLAISSPLFYSPPSLQSPLTHTCDPFESLDLPPPTYFEKKNDVLSDFTSFDLPLLDLKLNDESWTEFDIFGVHFLSHKLFTSHLTWFYGWSCLVLKIHYDHFLEDWSSTFDKLMKSLTGFLDDLLALCVLSVYILLLVWCLCCFSVCRLTLHFIHFYHIAKFSRDDPSKVILVYSVSNVGRDLAPSPPYPLTSPKPRLEDAQ